MPHILQWGDFVLKRISARYISFFVAIIFAFVLVAVNLNAGRDFAAVSAEINNAMVIIDAGHGGEDGGAVNEQGVSEKDINLDIARKLEKTLNLFGIMTAMTRTDDSALGQRDLATTRMRKVSDMRARVEKVINTTGADLISIHQNSFPQDKSCFGAQVFYSSGNVHSKKLAELVQRCLKETLDVKNDRTEKEAGKNIFLLNSVNCPAVLVECGFLTNEAESKLLLNEGYKIKIAASIVAGYLKFKCEK